MAMAGGTSEESVGPPVVFSLAGIAGVCFLAAVLGFRYLPSYAWAALFASSAMGMAVLVGSAIAIGNARPARDVRGVAIVFAAAGVAAGVPALLLRFVLGVDSLSGTTYFPGVLLPIASLLPFGLLIGAHITLVGTLRGPRTSGAPAGVAFLGMASSFFLPLVMATGTYRILAGMGLVLAGLMVGCDFVTAAMLRPRRAPREAQASSRPA